MLIMTQNIWQDPKVITWNQYLLDSYDHFLGQPLIKRQNNPLTEAKELFFSDFVVVSHNTQSPPLFNYGNQMALNLWEMNWEQFTQMPSQQSAEPEQRQQREKLLEKAMQQGYLQNIQGLRISRTGRHFWIQNVTLWNILDEQGDYIGQAATYPQWKFIDA